MVADALILRNEIPSVERCPVLTRVRAWIGDQGVCSRVEHQWVDRKGIPIDLSEMVNGSTNSNTSSSTSEDFQGSVVVRIHDAVNLSNRRPKLWEIDCDVVDIEEGLVQFDLIQEIVDEPDLYELNFGLKDTDDKVIMLNNGLLSVERSYFASDAATRKNFDGPPTIQSIRMHMQDSSANENLQLADIEFSVHQILDAVRKPSMIWNEALPPIPLTYTPKTFPWKYAQMEAIVAQLFLTAAQGYRRKAFPYQAGGVSINDQEKEREYLAEGNRRLEEFKQFVANHKMVANLKRVSGHYGSSYPG